MKFEDKSIVKVCSDEDTRELLHHVCIRFFPEPQDASKMKGAFMEATDGRKLVRVEVELDDDDAVPRDGTAAVLIHKDIIKGAVSYRGKTNKGPFVIKITDEAFVYFNGMSIPRNSDLPSWPNTNAVWPEPNVIGTGISINPKFVHECAEACGILEGSQIVMMFANTMLDPYVMAGSRGKAIIMPGATRARGGLVACDENQPSPESVKLCEQLDILINEFVAGYESERSSDGKRASGDMPTVMMMGWNLSRSLRQTDSK
jgi:hypothetical protein